MDKYFTRETIIAIGLVFPGLMTALGAVPVFFYEKCFAKAS